MHPFLFLACCVFVGLALQKSELADSGKHYNKFAISVALSALTIKSVQKIHLNISLIQPLLTAWLLLGVGLLFFWWVSKQLKLDRKSTGALILTGGFSASSLMGVPMTQAFFGEQAVGYAVLIGTASTCIAFPTAGVLIATYYGSETDGKVDRNEILKKFRSLPLFSLILALIMNIEGIHFNWLDDALTRFSEPMALMTFISLGLMIKLGDIKGNVRALVAGTIFKLALAPVLIYIINDQVIGLSGEALSLVTFSAAMPGMVSASALASDHDLNKQLARSMVMVTTILSLVTIPFASHVLH